MTKELNKVVREEWEAISFLCEEVLESIFKYEKTGVISKETTDEYLIDQELLDSFSNYIKEDEDKVWIREEAALSKELQYLMDENYSIDGYILITEKLFKQIIESVINQLDIKSELDTMPSVRTDGLDECFEKAKAGQIIRII